jgi:hypothetical protein
MLFFYAVSFLLLLASGVLILQAATPDFEWRSARMVIGLILLLVAPLFWALGWIWEEMYPQRALGREERVIVDN